MKTIALILITLFLGSCSVEKENNGNKKDKSSFTKSFTGGGFGTPTTQEIIRK